MAYRYTVGIWEKGKAYREASVVASSETEVKKACNALLASGTKVTIFGKRKTVARTRRT